MSKLDCCHEWKQLVDKKGNAATVKVWDSLFSYTKNYTLTVGAGEYLPE